jgi:ribosomal protein S18 acetylase RimI-like enzyme
LKVIPTRASFRHARELAEEAARQWSNDATVVNQLAEKAMLQLDDPHCDSLLAIQDGAAVARVDVLAVGEIGRIDEVYVAEPMRRRGIGRMMVARALEICGRSLFKHVLLACDATNTPAQALYAGLGFRKVGELARYAAKA